ncbi:DUF262 domain-containing protein [Blastococcus goldschmidtiae]|uniref:DUF262 domain-containing HNH endonuclease family protein n=1 Tax=Blastococcus goldschmidtiae TaxID=3075546 RepID=A0ABU2K937_9ACTN|nr:DUF262 domain-containing HNH endonuclease family protein [Blastococcus sp. DSM 46792]MDT0276663.1 DUF262 domain-containing HNH endonuclease family protein [Blastococcus sp. DSM 46792]
MQAQTHTPAAIFGSHIRYVVPLFQRRYVWDQAEQWAPLWDDVRALAEKVLETPSGYGAPPVSPHFLGAIVVDQQSNPSGFIQVRHVIDGQQRLTTLQLLLDAAQEVTEKHGAPLDAETLKVLVLNQPQVTQSPDEVFKVWPTDRDQDAFRAAMTNDSVVTPELATSRIARAHSFFVDQITEWCEPAGDPDKVAARLKALAQALHAHLKLVVIDLEPGDNAQVIFETLNHRGSRLLAADLVKNLLFQTAQIQQLDVASLYKQYWRPLDEDYWRELTAQGRLYRPRIDVFLNYWLVMKLLREVPADRIFIDFRDQVAASRARELPELLAEVAADAAVFSSLDSLPAGSAPARFYYRVIRALDTRSVMPVFLWLMRWSAEELPLEQRDKALNAIESWLVRRTLARLTGKNVNLVVLELLRALDEAGPADAGDRTERFLVEQTADSRLWPRDELIRESLATAPVYTSLVRARVRMLLEALEDDLRTAYGEGQPAPRELTVEHILPQKWRENWPLSPDDLAGAIARDRLLHVLGNLTLVSGGLNPALSNRPWTRDDGKGKRDYLLEHSALKLNAKLVTQHHEAWTEDDIRARTTALTERVLTLWPRPDSPSPADASAVSPEEAGAEPAEAVDEEVDDSSVPSHTGKYRKLWEWLRAQDADEIPLTFEEVEEVLGIPLPPSARLHMPHWYGYEGTALGRAIRDAGWKASMVDLQEQRVTFVPGA